MGWTVLYIAFGIVALWLLGEVLLQYKARLRWRLLAFVGFLGVVFGVLIPSVIVIGLGAAAFAVGQTYVTLSFRRGFAEGWAVGNRQGADSGAGKGFGKSKRRRGEEHEDPALEVSDLETAEGAEARAEGLARGAAYPQGDDFTREDDVFSPAHSDRFMPPGSGDLTAAEAGAVYEPQPLPDDTGSYGVYSDTAYAAATEQSYAAAAQAQAQDQQAYAYDGYSTGYDQQQYGYDNGQQQYAAYSDPYIGTQTYGGASYDTTYGGGDQQYTQQQQGYGQDQYATGGYGGETPAGGVWVPQQRNTDDPYGGELPQEQPYPYQGNANGAGYDEQYRY
ncbi:SCO2102 family sporulation regulator [Streptomyces mirabilis]|uniref:SCO2102 family sporulation regulator n=1 Tax=Streptomyces mirabilis TaxID=68239 RepID=UPI00369F5145